MSETIPENVAEIAILDLSTTITRDQYKESIIKLLAELDRVSHEMGWCSERHRYFAAVMDEYYDGEADFGVVPEYTDYAARLRTMRARMLWYVRAETIGLDLANRLFTAMGLPEYDSNPKAGARYRVELNLELGITGEDVTEYIQRELPAMITKMMDDRSSETGNRFVPGSVVILRPYVTRMSTAPAINAADTERPSYS